MESVKKIDIRPSILDWKVEWRLEYTLDAWKQIDSRNLPTDGNNKDCEIELSNSDWKDTRSLNAYKSNENITMYLPGRKI